MSNVLNFKDTMPLVDVPLVCGVREGFKTEEEAVEFWKTLSNRLEWAIQAVATPKKDETIAFIFVPVDPKLYKNYFKSGSVTV
jgi:hypothetical protein